MPSILDLLFPPKCNGCGVLISEGSFCSDCTEKIRREVQNICLQTRRIPLVKPECPVYCTVAFSYDGVVRKAILDFKLRGKKELVNFFAEELYILVREKYSGISFDMVTCIPMHRERLVERGYNQSELLAVGLGKKMKVTVEKRALISKKGLCPQHTLPFAERLVNMQGAYSAGCRVKGKTVLLCDDIVTSGSTLLEGAETLLKSGAKAVFCAGIAATRDKGTQGTQGTVVP